MPLTKKRLGAAEGPGAAAPPYWATNDGETARLYLGDVLDVLARLPERSVHCVITSPPYWGLRDYGVAGQIGSEPSPDCGTLGRAQCGGCFVCKMVAVFRAVRRVLRDDGTLWLNLGDTYSGGKSGRDDNDAATRAAMDRHGHGGGEKLQATGNTGRQRKPTDGIPSGNLVGVPWRVALALQADGWMLRQDVIWHKPSPMPESVSTRCTKAHEYVFLLAKSARYYYDAEAIKEASKKPDEFDSSNAPGYSGNGRVTGGTNIRSSAEKRNKRSVWTVPSQGYPGAHFATFPPKLIEPMILAGTSAHGCCAACWTPWRRVVEKVKLTRERPNEYVKRAPVFHGGGKGSGGNRNDDGRGTANPKAVDNTCANTVAGVGVRTTGWEPSCGCHGEQYTVRTWAVGQAVADSDVGIPNGWAVGAGRSHRAIDYATPAEVEDAAGQRRRAAALKEKGRWVTTPAYRSALQLDEHPVVPCTVLDPFVGSGTTVCVAVLNGRRGRGLDLSEAYLAKNAVPRVTGALLSVPRLAGLVPARRAGSVHSNNGNGVGDDGVDGGLDGEAGGGFGRPAAELEL